MGGSGREAPMHQSFALSLKFAPGLTDTVGRIDTLKFIGTDTSSGSRALEASGLSAPDLLKSGVAAATQVGRLFSRDHKVISLS
jgi:hypothetical protein